MLMLCVGDVVGERPAEAAAGWWLGEGKSGRAKACVRGEE